LQNGSPDAVLFDQQRGSRIIQAVSRGNALKYQVIAAMLPALITMDEIEHDPVAKRIRCWPSGQVAGHMPLFRLRSMGMDLRISRRTVEKIALRQRGSGGSIVYEQRVSGNRLRAKPHIATGTKSRHHYRGNRASSGSSSLAGGYGCLDAALGSGVGSVCYRPYRCQRPLCARGRSCRLLPARLRGKLRGCVLGFVPPEQ